VLLRLDSLKRSFSSKLDHFLITDPKNIFYFTGFGGSGILLVSLDEKPILFVSEMEFNAAQEKAKDCQVFLFNRTAKIWNRITEELSSRKARKVGIDDFSITLYEYLIKKAKGTEFLLKTDLVWDLRKMKSEEEIGKMKQAAEIASYGFKAASEVIAPGRTEIEVAAEVEYAMRRKGSEGLPFDSIIASGHNSALPHAYATNKKINADDLVVVDIGATHGGYCIDITRTFVAGKATKRQKEIYNTVLEAHDTAIGTIRQGVKAMEVDCEARLILRKMGYEKYFIHNLGHGVGLEVHEPPRLTSINREKLQEGYVLTVEPGVYISGYGGVRIEDTILVKKNEAENLVKVPYDLD
jgi:Xaa-Pro dipeptidase